METESTDAENLVSAMKLVTKVIDPTIGAAFFNCRICGEIEMTPKQMMRAEYSSAFARFKLQHMKCK